MCGHPLVAEAIDFDDGNESELARHGISAVEVWQVVTNDPTWVPNKKGGPDCGLQSVIQPAVGP